jgi:hypothetical protein
MNLIHAAIFLSSYVLQNSNHVTSRSQRLKLFLQTYINETEYVVHLG